MTLARRRLHALCQLFLKNCTPALDKRAFVGYIILMKFETGTIVTHIMNPRWKAVVVNDIFPRRTTWGMVKVCVLAENTARGKGFVTNLPKSLLKKVAG